MADDALARDVAEYLRLLSSDVSASIGKFDELRETYDHTYDVEEHRVRLRAGEQEATVRFPSLHRLAEAYNTTADAAEKEEIRSALDDEYHYFGTIDRSFYRQSGETYLLDDEYDQLLRRIDSVQQEYGLEDMIDHYQWIREVGDIDDVQEVWSTNRELFRAGETGAAEVFYDQLRNQIYVFDRSDITLEPESTDILGELEVIDLPDVDSDRDDATDTLFEQLFDPDTFGEDRDEE